MLGDWSKKVGGAILSERDVVDQQKRARAQERAQAQERLARREQQELFEGSDEEILALLREKIAGQVDGQGKLLKAFKMFRESSHSAQNKVATHQHTVNMYIILSQQDIIINGTHPQQDSDKTRALTG